MAAAGDLLPAAAQEVAIRSISIKSPSVPEAEAMAHQPRYVGLNSWMGWSLVGDLWRRLANPLFQQGVAQAIAIHIPLTDADTANEPARGGPPLQGCKLRQIEERMAKNVAEEFNDDRLPGQAGLSKFYFNRLLKECQRACRL